MEKVIGLDIGTQGTKAVLIDLKQGILCYTFSGYKPSYPKPLYAEQWPHVWEQAVYKVVQELLQKTGVNKNDIKAIAISSLYGGSGIPVDRYMTPIHPCLIWMDRRATKEVEWVRENIDLDMLYETTGNFVDSYYGFTKMMWLKNNKPDVWKDIHYLLSPNAYITYQLTGEVAIDYSSAGNIGGVFDIKKRTWSSDMLKKLDIPETYMPHRLVASSEIVGEIHRKGAEATGLLEGTAVISGGIDAAVATLAAGVFRPGTHIAMVGTSMCWGFITRDCNLSPGLVSMPYVYKPKEYVYSFGGAMTAGAIISWFIEQFGIAEKEAARLLDKSEYAFLETAASDIPAGSSGLIMLPYFMGERNPIWDPYALGTFVGLNLTHTRGHVYRSIMEGVAYSLRHNMEEVSGLVDLNEDLIMVGGAAKSDLWTEIFSDITGYSIYTIKEDVEAPLGDALLAFMGYGLIDDPSKIREWFTIEERAIPNKNNKNIYDKGFSLYKELYHDLKSTMRKWPR